MPNLLSTQGDMQMKGLRSKNAFETSPSGPSSIRLLLSVCLSGRLASWLPACLCVWLLVCLSFSLAISVSVYPFLITGKPIYLLSKYFLTCLPTCTCLLSVHLNPPTDLPPYIPIYIHMVYIRRLFLHWGSMEIKLMLSEVLQFFVFMCLVKIPCSNLTFEVRGLHARAS